MNTYQEYARRIIRMNPLDYQDAGTTAHLDAQTAPLDDLAIRARTVMLARLPTYAPEDALLLLAQDRGLRRYPNEDLASFQNRVVHAFDFWAMAGTVPGLLFGLEQLGWEAVVQEHFRDPDPVRWAEFSVTITNYPKTTPDAPRWGAFQWGDGTRWGGRQGQDVSTILALIQDLKPAHARLRSLTLRADPPPVWGAFQWGDGTHWGGVIAHFDFIGEP